MKNHHREWNQRRQLVFEAVGSRCHIREWLKRFLVVLLAFFYQISVWERPGVRTRSVCHREMCSTPPTSSLSSVRGRWNRSELTVSLLTGVICLPHSVETCQDRSLSGRTLSLGCIKHSFIHSLPAEHSQQSKQTCPVCQFKSDMFFVRLINCHECNKP